MRKIILIILILFSYSAYVYFNIIKRENIIFLLNSNLPFRESYFPNLLGLMFVYVFPFLLGYFSSRYLKNKNYSPLFFINLALAVGVLYLLPYLPFESYFYENVLNGSMVVYACMLFTLMFLLGTFLNWPKHEEKIERINSEISKQSYFVAIILGVIVFLLNLIPFFLSDYLVGADVYYHSTLTRDILEGKSVLENPYFKEEQNYYYSIVYFVLAYSSKLIGGNVELIWFLNVPLAGGLFIIFFYLFAHRALGNTSGAVIATVFMITSSQILWTDPSIRNLSYAFLMITIYTIQSFIIRKRYYKILIALLFYILTVLSHIEIGLHITGIIVFYFVVNKLIFLFKYFRLKKKVTHELSFIGFLSKNESRVLLILLSMYFLFFLNQVIGIMSSFPITSSLVYNEIPLSVFQPIGLSSFLVFLFLPLGLVYFLKNLNKQNVLIIAISSLFLTVIFLFSHIWFLYHRYFAETAYIGLVIIATYPISKIFLINDKKTKIIFSMIIAGFFLVSIYPKFQFIYMYSTSVNNSLNSSIVHINFIKDNTEIDSVVLMNPSNALGRYFPFYGHRYIFQGSGKISKEQQWQVLSFCNGPFAKSCDNRYLLAKDFYNNPTKQSLENIRKEYKIDYILASKLNGEDANINSSDLGMKVVGNNNIYSLYIIK